MKFPLTALVSTSILLISCSTTSWFNSTQGQAVLGTGETIAKVAWEAAATNYGGPVAGQLAGSGLDALAAVLQGYIGKSVPTAIVKASPGTKAVGNAVAPLVASDKPVAQSD